MLLKKQRGTHPKIEDGAKIVFFCKKCNYMAVGECFVKYKANKMTFEETDLKRQIKQAVETMGFTNLTPIQEQTIPFILNNPGDLIALAQTGTGKTAAFGLPVLQFINGNNKDTQALVLCPTRELCLQITGDLQNFSKLMSEISIVPVYGGASIEPQIKQLKKKAQIVVATPGRAIDLMERKVLKLNNINWLVLDEADEMLSMGFKDDLDTIFAQTPEEKRTLLFSATMPADIERMAQNYMRDYKEIAVAQKNIAAENVEHQYFMVKAKDRYEALKRIADVNPDIYAIVFCRTRMECKEVADKLMSDGYNADALHGDLSQAQRDNVMQRFRSKHLQILVATDVAARGLDVNDLSHVINYNLPDDPEVYIHRSGRTGRAGKSGISISILHLREKGKMKDIERLCKKRFVQKTVPNGREICEIQLLNLIDKMRSVEIDQSQIESFNKQIAEKLGDMSRDEIIKKFLSLEFNRFLDYYRNAKDINIDEKEKPSRESKEGGHRHGKTKCTRLFINLGSRDNIAPKKLMGFINRIVDNRDVYIGAIDIMRNFSFFEVDEPHAKEVVDAMNDSLFDGQIVSVEIASQPSKEEKPHNKDGRRNKKEKDFPKRGFSKRDFGKQDFFKKEKKQRKKSW